MIVNETTSVTDETPPTCVASNVKWVYLVIIPLPFIAGLLNILVWVAATFNRKKLLRHSYIYLCVSSTLLSNILFLTLHLWEEIATYLMDDGSASSPPNSMLKLLWTICTSAWIAMLSAVCGNLAVLVFVMLDSTSFMKSPQQQALKDARKLEFRRKRRRAIGLIIFVWTISFALTLISTMVWNCVDFCNCSPNAKGEVCMRSHGCSRVWPPMKNSYMGLNVGIWFVEVIVLVFVTTTGIRNFSKFHQLSRNKEVSYQNVNSLPQDSSNGSAKNIEYPPANGNKETREVEEKNKAQEKGKRNFKILFNPRLRLMSFLSAFFIISTSFIPIVFFIDFFGHTFPVFDLRLTTMVMVQIYTLVFPILLLRYLANLKSAVLSLAGSLLFCCK